jgi:hypothetical protein
MRNAFSCVHTGGKAVYRPVKTVFRLCKFIVQSSRPTTDVLITMRLCPDLYVSCTPGYPPKNTAANRGVFGLIPTIHTPNNKSYMDTIEINTGKLWIGSYTT